MAGLDAARLARLDGILAGHVDSGSTPGLVALVSRGEQVHVSAHGTTERDGAGRPVTRDTIFRIASMSKPVAAVATLILVEECLLRLEDPVDALLPELADRRVLRTMSSPLADTVPAHRQVTVRDLLTFTWGFGQLFADPDDYPVLAAARDAGIGMGPPAPGSMPAPDEWIKRLGALPLLCQPGERWLYNTGSDVLSVLVARAAGQPFAEFLRERVFTPLGMADTGFSVPAGKLGRFLPAYHTNFATGAIEVFDPVDGQWATEPAFPAGSGGMVSTVDDYLALARMLLSGGRYPGGRLLSRPSVELLATDHLTPAQKAISGLLPSDFDAMGWGYGVAVVTRRDDVRTIGSYGWNGGLGSVWHNDPREDLVTILLTNQGWTSPWPPAVFRDVITTAYGALDD